MTWDAAFGKREAMSRKLFAQIALLILFGGLVYLACVELLGWQSGRSYEAMLQRYRENQAPIATVPSQPSLDYSSETSTVGEIATGNDSMIDGQKVVRRGSHWVNTKGKILGDAGD